MCVTIQSASPPLLLLTLSPWPPPTFPLTLPPAHQAAPLLTPGQRVLCFSFGSGVMASLFALRCCEPLTAGPPQQPDGACMGRQGGQPQLGECCGGHRRSYGHRYSLASLQDGAGKVRWWVRWGTATAWPACRAGRGGEGRGEVVD